MRTSIIVVLALFAACAFATPQISETFLAKVNIFLADKFSVVDFA